MLTRIEIDGFKSFRGFELDVPPFLVIIGKNAAGKSNLFDAIQFLSRLAGMPVLDAAQQMRGDVSDLFHAHLDGSRVDSMSFAVEVLLDREVTDASGDTAEVNHSRLRYELTIELRSTGPGGAKRPFVVREEARRIRRTDDKWIRRFDPDQRDRLALYRGGGATLLTTDNDEHGRLQFTIRQQGNQGRPRRLPATAATATVLSSLTTATDFPLLYALKRELQSWRLLHLDPSALRAPDRTTTRILSRRTARTWRTLCAGSPTKPAQRTDPRERSTSCRLMWRRLFRASSESNSTRTRHAGSGRSR